MPVVRTTWYFWRDPDDDRVISLCPRCSFNFPRLYPNLAQELNEPFLGIPDTRQPYDRVYAKVSCHLCNHKAKL